MRKMIQIAMVCRDVLIEENFLLGLRNCLITVMYVWKLKNTVPESTSALHNVCKIDQRNYGKKLETYDQNMSAFILRH